MTLLGLRTGACLLVLGLAGCATRGDLVAQDRRLRGLIQEQKRSIEQVKREVERLRAHADETGGRPRAPGELDRVGTLEQRIAALEASVSRVPDVIGETPAPSDDEPPLLPVEPPPVVAAIPTTTTTLPPRPSALPVDEDEWRREVQQEQAAVATLNVPERDDYVRSLDDLGRRDCAKAVPALNGLASKSKGSALADNALYWAARCYAARGDQNQAISKFYDVVTRYPKSDKAPAALWAQGNLFLQIGDTPDARLALGKLIRDYPNSAEAARARQKLTEIEQ